MSDRSARDRFDEVYALVREPLYRYLARRAAADAVDDLFTEVLIVLWRRVSAVPDGGEVPWTYAVARRTLANHRRAHGRAARLLAKLAMIEPGVDPGPEPRSGDMELESALGKLRSDDRELLRLFAWEQLTAAEIAVAIGVSANVAGVRLFRAKERLRNILAKDRGNENATPGHRFVVERKEGRK
jgi:RNA polymerase sigma-70 factor (ECF subfamily)